MMSGLIKYKHYLLVLIALLLTHYIVMPLVEWSKEQHTNLFLIEKQYDKTQSLLGKQSLLSESLKSSQKELLKIKEVAYEEQSVDKFKLKVQSSIEKALTSGGCETERIGFQGSTEVVDTIQRWAMEIRFKGDVLCLTHLTRKLESLSPYMQIDSYNLNHRGLTNEVAGKLNARVNLNVWYKEVNE